jgi:hypothetical protein
VGSGVPLFRGLIVLPAAQAGNLTVVGPTLCLDSKILTDVGCSVSEAEVTDPARTISIADASNIELWHEAYLDYVPATGLNRSGRDGAVPAFRRHNDGFNAVHGDGHVHWYRAGSTKPSLWTIQADESP